jgi:ATP-dependent Clp protease ATP-binding subunit ClpA
MAERFDKFTGRARRVLSLAQQEAQGFNHNYIGTEHLLLGLVREGEGVGAAVLVGMGVDAARVREAVGLVVGRGDQMVMGQIGLTPRAKRVIELSVEEARRLNHQYIGTEHLLLGLVHEGEGVAAGVLNSLGVSLDRTRAQVVHVLSQAPGYAASTAPTDVPPGSVEPSLGYTPAARRAFALAQAEAGRLGHSYLGSGHVLVGLLADREENPAVRVMKSLGLGLEAARAELARATWPAEEAATAIGPTPRLQYALSLAAMATRRRGADAVDGGDLLLGLLVEGDNAAADVLQRLGQSPAAVRAAVEAALDAG